jgi:HAD superfamily hydrolase (TIGR01490 family)
MKENSRRPFAVFDIDGTLIRWQLYHAIADTLAEQGQINPKIYQTMKEARMAWKRRSGGSFQDYERQVIEVYEAVLTSLSFEQFETAIEAVFEEYKEQVYTYTRDLIDKLKKEGYLLFAVSGSQTEIVAKIADYYGFDDYVGTVYARSKNRFTGAKTIGSLNKDTTLEALAHKHGTSFKGSIGVGDSRSDISMLELVEQPIALNPEKDLFKHAISCGWKIVVERKNVVFELESVDGKYQLAKTNQG